MVTSYKSWHNVDYDLARTAELLIFLAEQGETDFSNTIMTYLTDGGEFVSHGEFMAKLRQVLSDDKEQTMRTFSEHFTNYGIEKGLKQGRQEGRQEMVINMLKNGISIDLVAKTSGLTHKTVEALYAKLKNNDH